MDVTSSQGVPLTPSNLHTVHEECEDGGPGPAVATTPPLRKRVNFAMMNTQGSHANAMGEMASVHGQTTNGYHQDGQGKVQHQPQGYVQHQMATAPNGKDMNGNVLAQAFNGLSVHNTRPGGKYAAPSGNTPTPHGANIDSNGVQRHQGGYMIMPNGPMVGTMPPAPPFSQITPPHRPMDQGSPLQYLPTNVYPGFFANPSMVPGPAPGYSWPYCFNDHEVSGVANYHPESWTSVDENYPGNYGDMAGQSHYYPAMMPHDRSPAPGYMHHGNTGPIPYQMMRTPSGYALQDIDALVKQDPPIPHAVPAMWTNSSDMTLAKCLENREGITNVYIRGFLPETNDEMLETFAARFGKIDRCKAIIDLDTGLCKGFGFVQFFSFEACENCIRGFFHLGYQASFAQKSRNSRLKDLEDRSSTNIYCTNLPMEWAEADLRRHFEPYRVVSEKISRDEKTGVSREVGFARFESRDIAERVLAEFHNVSTSDGVKLLLRFADTKAQKQLKHQSNERRAYRAGEYNYSVEMVQGTPSPGIQRLQQAASHFSPASQGSFPSPMGPGHTWTPATSISPPGPVMMNKPMDGVHRNSTSGRGGPNGENATITRPYYNRGGNHHETRQKTRMSASPARMMPCKTPSPSKGGVRAGTTSPVPSRKEIHLATPKSSI